MDKYDTESIKELIEEWAKDLPEWITEGNLDQLIDDINEFCSTS